MALHPSRRSLLQWCGAAGGVVLGGCSGGDLAGTSTDDDMPASTAEDTRTPRSTVDATDTHSAMPDQFAFDASVASQASPEAPATLWVQLTNESDRPARVGTGPVLASDLVFGTTEFVLLPDTYVGPNKEDIERSGRCWRYVGDGPYVQSILKWHNLAPGESLSAGFGVHTRGRDRPCLPSGTTRLLAEVLLSEEGTTMDLALIIEVDDERQVSVAAEGPT